MNCTSELQGLLKQASCGLHTMLDEHFGISIVEYMAAGAIAIGAFRRSPSVHLLPHHGSSRQDVSYLITGQAGRMSHEPCWCTSEALCMLVPCGSWRQERACQVSLCLPLAAAHNSGGPKADILRPVEDASGAMLPVGFLAESEEEYARALREALALSSLDRHAMALRARQRAASYSQQQFAEAVQRLLGPVAEEKLHQ